jgi:hypothetical protein
MQETEGGVWIEAADAQNLISEYKLGQMVSARSGDGTRTSA